MAVHSGGSQSTAQRDRELPAESRPPDGEPTTPSKYLVLGKDALLDSILGEAAHEAAAEEAVLTEQLERKRRDEQAHREAEAAARREAAQASVVEARHRRQQGREVRRRVALEIEEEELRASGLWDRVVEHGDSDATNTGEREAMTSSELAAGRVHDTSRTSELATAPTRRLPVLPIAVAGLLLLGGLVLAFAGSGVDVDVSTYQRSDLAVSGASSTLDEVAVRRLQERPERVRRTERPREHRDDRIAEHATAGPSDDDPLADDRRPGSSPDRLDVSLDDASDLWRVGSE